MFFELAYGLMGLVFLFLFCFGCTQIWEARGETWWKERKLQQQQQQERAQQQQQQQQQQRAPLSEEAKGLAEFFEKRPIYFLPK